EWLCDDQGRCPALIGDILVYRDGNHISETAASWLSPLVEAVVAPFVSAWVSQPA
ncbi:MAG: SGNH hydrolase domain-containing protein, partial [Ilumatobacteraceae bacterium]